MDLSNNSLLSNFYATNTSLSTLDLTQNINLTYFDVSNNSLVSLDLRNGNNTNLSQVILNNNPLLNCINVDDSVYSNNNWSCDLHCFFSNNCSIGCTDTNAINYNSLALTDDGSCIYPPSDLSLQGIIDFTVPGGGNAGKAIHVVALQDIPDLSIYGIGVANNGGGTDGQEYIFDTISVLAGEDILVARDISVMTSYFDGCFSQFDHILQANIDISQNGDDAIELFMSGSVVETFGDINVDGSGQPWEYLDSWAYKINSGTSGAFNLNNWSFGGVNCTDGTTTIYDASCLYPICPSLSYIPDNNFENYLEANGMGDGIALNDYVLTSNINNIDSLSINNLSISDVTGIEDFIALTYFQCHDNQITSLNVSNNIYLTHLHCYSNQITSLDVTNNLSLIQFWFGTNQVTSIDVSNNSALTSFVSNNNLLTSLDLSANTALWDLGCGANPLTALDLSNNTNLTYLYCDYNQINSLDLSNNTGLSRLSCGYNQITTLDLSQHTSLTEVYCRDNQLVFLDVKNGNNLNFNNYFYSQNNPDLYCINVDDSTYSTNNWTNLDTQQFFSSNCSSYPNPNLTYVPDDNFENYLEANGMGDGIALMIMY